MKTKIVLFIGILSMVFSGCKKKEEGAPGLNEIWLEYKAFNPSQLTVAAGTTVTFINKDNADHWVASTNNFNSGKIKSGDTFTFTFTTAGTFYFYCNYHTSNSSEQGAIKVQ